MTVLNTITTELTSVRASIVKFFAKLLGLGEVVVSKVETTVVADVDALVTEVKDLVGGSNTTVV